MNETYSENRDATLVNVEQTDLSTNSLEQNSVPFVETELVNDDVIQETSLDEVVVATEVDPDDASVYEAPMGNTSSYNTPVNKLVTHEDHLATEGGSLAALLNQDDSEHFRTRWNEIQGQFVDEPRTAVQQADELVSEVVEKITQMFADEHNSLESQWNQGNDVSTEDLRMALQHYRSFFNRLVI